MRTLTALVTLVLLTASFQTPTLAKGEGRARLRLVVVDQNHAVVPNATVTVFTLDGNLGTTVTADAKGVARFPDLPTGLAQVYARTTGYAPFIEKTTLRRGDNAQTATLHVRGEAEVSTSGS
jgi:hypothetical protein